MKNIAVTNIGKADRALLKNKRLQVNCRELQQKLKQE